MDITRSLQDVVNIMVRKYRIELKGNNFFSEGGGGEKTSDLNLIMC